MEIGDRVFFATGNSHKAAELKSLLLQITGRNITVDCMEALGVEETGSSFLENAAIKARALAAQLTNEDPTQSFIVLADDSGLCVDALGGAPGIYSARFAGPQCDAAANRNKLLLELLAVAPRLEQRTAHFECALWTIEKTADGEIREVCATGRSFGWIALQESGKNGFGYDSLFVDKDSGISYAELDNAEKNKISHRFRAVSQMFAE